MEQSDGNILKKTEEETKKKALGLHKEIDGLQKELNDLQETCEHTETVVRQKPGDAVKKYCSTCDKYLIYPTEKELEIYLYGNDRSTRKD
jgi:uncharacterized protein YlxW (UPF0749 family)